ncbi:TetR/AcrR family transcriptional regulator [Actinomadura macrotermitis]|uniref:HTH tetR-type domain-containing protein n=1 Tax=Actinomadura macrotermitis TaxID=2585200 RepID=A0A7K0C2F8_9ACTN|nr:TetR/AcrR family transcriptional regulator [Actinomadura macrotermitis]MQY07014.1 hypothetical protein [Actinomadura macrotermitis]
MDGRHGTGNGDLGRLPSGRHRLSRDFVAGHQVSRILAAVIEVAGTAGYQGLTVDSIIAVAGVSRATFYVHFKNKEDAFGQAYDLLISQLMEKVLAAVRDLQDAPARLRAGLGAFLQFLADDPQAARTCIVEALAAGPAAAGARDAALAAFAQVIADDVRELYPHYPDPDLMGESIVGGIHQVAYSRIRRGAAAELPGLLQGLLSAFAVPDPQRWGPGAPPPK